MLIIHVFNASKCDRGIHVDGHAAEWHSRTVVGGLLEPPIYPVDLFFEIYEKEKTRHFQKNTDAFVFNVGSGSATWTKNNIIRVDPSRPFKYC